MHSDIKKQFNVEAHYNTPLRLGQVDFINCLPINFPIELGEVKINTKLINDVPRKLNELILKCDIDIAPISSLTYIENKDKLVPIGDLCISSNGPADSVLLFSHFPIEELHGAKIALSPASATSNKLLEILLKEFLKIDASYKIEAFHETLLESKDYSACLFIGDHALLEFSKKPRDLFIYDLGSLWKKHTGLPMTFGVWVVRKEALTNFPKEVETIIAKLKESKEIGLGKLFDKVIKKAQEKVLISTEFYNTYFHHLSYEFTNECKKGLSIFENYCNNLNPNLLKTNR
ncbi:MAG: menaquinone biosynthesis protein [Candidatus Melainabacteria bacterium]|nr:menaquinone biosynthesis protein [Candidatus Melainabacteria bacterium]